MVHTFNCHGPFIFTNNSSKQRLWERKAAVSDKRGDLVQEVIRKWVLKGQQWCAEKKITWGERPALTQ